MSNLRARRAVGAIFFAIGTDVGAWASRIPDFKALLGLEEGPLGMALLAIAFGSMCGFPMAGYVVDRFGAFSATKVFVLIILAAFVSLPLGANSVALFVGLLFFLGIFLGSIDVAMNAWGAEVEAALGKPVMSSYHGLFSAGAVAGAGGGAVALWLDFSVAVHYLIWAALLLVPVGYALTTPWKSERAAVSESKGPMFALPKGALIIVGLMCLVGGLGEGSITDWAAIYQIQELGINETLAAITFAVYSGAMVLMRFSGDKLIARHGSVRIARLSGIASLLGGLLIVWAPSLPMLWLGAVVMGFGNASIFPLAVSRAAADPTMSKGNAIASVAALGYGAFLFGPPILGFIGEHASLRISFLCVALMAFVIIFFAGFFRVDRQEA